MKKCLYCKDPSLKGLRIPLCQYHYNVSAYGKKWADHCLKLELAKKEKTS